MSIFNSDPHFARMSKAIAELPRKPGLDPHALGEGDVVTVSRCRVTGDRSYIGAVWRIKATNGYQVLLEWAGVGDKPYRAEEPILIQTDERDFYDGRCFMKTEDQHD